MIFLADRGEQADSAYHTLIKHINSKYPIVMVNWCENFVFNDELLKIKDYCLICFCEESWNLELTKTHI